MRNDGTFISGSTCILPLMMLNDVNIGPRSIMLYAYLSSGADENGKVETMNSDDQKMMEFLHMARETFYKAKKELSDAGYLEQIKTRSRGRFDRTIYILKNPQEVIKNER